MATNPSDPQPPRLVDYALAYARRDIPVFPCIARDKKPLTDHGLKDATTDAEQIQRWWKRWPRANIGIPTGPQSGWLAVDIDTKAGATYDTLAAIGPLPTTMTAQTGSGGLHLIFRYPRNGLEVRNSASKVAQGVDVRGDGGYIVAAPSIHPSGGIYEWVKEIEPTPCPSWLLKLMTAVPERPGLELLATRKATDASADDRDAYWLDWALAQAQPGTSDAAGYKLAQQLLTDPGVRDIDGTLAEYARMATFNTNDPFDERDIDRWLKSAQASNIVRRGESAKNPKPRAQTARPLPAKQERPKLRAVPTVEEEPADYGIKYSEEPPDPPDDSALLKGEADDNGNAEAMYRLFGKEYLFTPAYGWLRWTGTHWKDEPEAIVTQSAITTLKRRRHAAVEADNETIIRATKADKSRVLGCLTLFKSYVIEPNVAIFDADPDLLNCRNGVLNLRTGTLTPHDPSQRFTYCVPVDYDLHADMTEWQTFLLSALDRDEVAARYFQLCTGYSLTGHTREEKMFYIYGPPRAGKGTVTETVLSLLPHPLSTEADFASFTAKRDNDSQNFDLAELKPSRIVIASESNRYQALNPAKIKSLTGGNYIRCAFKHKDMFTYRPQFKVWLVSNHQVTADADDEALWGRVQVFTFPNSHLGTEDVTLKARMRASANLRGVLRWAVEGAMAWYADGLTPPEAVVTATREHRDTQDYLKMWLDDCCTLDPEHWTPSAGLLTSYREWCEQNSVKPVRPNDFSVSLVKRFGCTQKRQAHTGIRGYMGIRLGVTPGDG
ncbi:MAG TPA: phage/plasmid primase, P4 family [Ktedonobacterales bacterium]|nr:phage/plasmid primase, P4 family [Ktedonobacterales bacterium]